MKSNSSFSLLSIFTFVSFVLFVGSPLLAKPVELKPETEFSAGYSNLDIDGNAEIEGGSLIPSNIDLQDDLGLEDDGSIDLELRHQLNDSFRIRLGYSTYEFTGSDSITRTINFRNQSFSADTIVRSNFEFDFGSADLLYNYQNSEKGYIDFLVGVRAIDFKGKISSDTAEESESLTAGTPVIGIDFRRALSDKLYFQGNAAGMDISSGDNDFSYIDLQGALGYKLSPQYHLRVGYRNTSIDGETDDDKLDLTFDGYNAGITGYF